VPGLAGEFGDETGDVHAIAGEWLNPAMRRSRRGIYRYTEAVDDGAYDRRQIDPAFAEDEGSATIEHGDGLAGVELADERDAKKFVLELKL
jgi:hypothetical protein